MRKCEETAAKLCATLFQQLDNSITDVWLHKLWMQRDCGRVTCELTTPHIKQEVCDTWRQGCLTDLPCVSTQQLLQMGGENCWTSLKKLAPASRRFFLIGFHLSDLSVVKLDVCTEKKTPSPSSTPNTSSLPAGSSPGSNVLREQVYFSIRCQQEWRSCEKRHPTALITSGYFVSDLCLGIISFGYCWVCHDALSLR